jgi:hypothetical protein
MSFEQSHFHSNSQGHGAKNSISKLEKRLACAKGVRPQFALYNHKSGGMDMGMLPELVWGTREGPPPTPREMAERWIKALPGLSP